MKIGGIQKFSLVDYPGLVSAVLFTTGCNMRCGYCHNPELVVSELYGESLDLNEVYAFLDSRRDKLEGVVITGGEPTLRKDLPDMVKKIKSMGYRVKLDSNGTHPEVLGAMINANCIDYVAMDIKGSLEKYASIAARLVDTDAIKKSIQVILASNVHHEFRTTVVQSQLSFSDFDKMGQLIKGAQLFSIQKFVPAKTLDPSFAKERTYDEADLVKIKKIMKQYVDKCAIR